VVPGDPQVIPGRRSIRISGGTVRRYLRTSTKKWRIGVRGDSEAASNGGTNGIYLLTDNRTLFYALGSGNNFTTWYVNLPYSCGTGDSIYLDQIAVFSESIMGIADNGGAAGNVYTWHPNLSCWSEISPATNPPMLSIAAPLAFATSSFTGFLASDANGNIYATYDNGNGGN
jgi:hypothetical protein